MMNKILLNNDTHREMKVSDDIDPKVMGDAFFVPVTIHEFVAAASEFVLAFIKNQETGAFQPVALTGMEQGENLYLDSMRRKWLGLYLPASLKYAPFSLVRTNQDDNHDVYLAIDESNKSINRIDGNRFFTDSGGQTPFLNSLIENLNRYNEDALLTEKLCQVLVGLELLEPKDLTFKIEGLEDRIIRDVYMVNPARLSSLAADEFGVLREKGLLPPIYAQLSSLYQTRRLVHLKNALASVAPSQ